MDYGATAREAFDALKDAGALVTLAWTVSGEYDPSQGGAAASTNVTVTTYGAVLPYPTHKIGTQPDSLVRAGDQWLLLAALDLAGDPLPEVPPEAVATLADGSTRVVKNPEPLAPAGVTVLYDITLRR